MNTEIRTLKLRRPKSGGQVEGVVSITGVHPYTEVFGSMNEARAFAERWELELIEPEVQDGLPEGSPQDNRGRQP